MAANSSDGALDRRDTAPPPDRMEPPRGVSSYGGGAARPSAWIGGADVSAPAALPVNTWSHIATTWNGTTWKFYVNGVEKASKAFSGPITASTGPLKIGGNSIWGEWFSGKIDDVRIYNRGITATEVQADMARAVG